MMEMELMIGRGLVLQCLMRSGWMVDGGKPPRTRLVGAWLEGGEWFVGVALDWGGSGRGWTGAIAMRRLGRRNVSATSS